MNMYGYVYLTTNLVNGKLYVGQKKGKFNPKYFGSGSYLKQAIKKYGKHNFRVKAIEYANDKITLDMLEIKYVAECRNYIGKDNVYNLADGGDGCPGWKASEETRKKMKESASHGNHAGKKNGMFGKVGRTAEHKWISNLQLKQSRWANKEEFSDYINNGWIRGRKFFPGSGGCTNGKNRNSWKGKKWISNVKLHQSKLVTEDALQGYTKEGWIRGRMFNCGCIKVKFENG